MSESSSTSTTTTKHPSVLQHFIVPETLPPGDFKAKCGYCKPEKSILLLRPERCNLKDSRFEELMFIRCNLN